MQPRKSSSTLVRKNMRLSNHSEDVKNKVYLLKHFEKYMMSKLYGDYDYTFVDATRTTGMSFVQRYFRTKHGMVFLFSHDTIQVRRVAFSVCCKARCLSHSSSTSTITPR